MKSNPLHRFRSARVGAITTSFILLACGPVFGAALTWDANSGLAGAQDGGGTWTTGAGNWRKTTAPAANNVNWADADTATFGAGTDGTYAIIVGGAISATSLTFSNSGYTLSAASARLITVTAATGISVASGESATIGTNVEVRKSSAGFIIGGGGTLNITGTGAIVRAQGGAFDIRVSGGTTVNVGTGGSLLSGASVRAGEAGTNAINVNGGTVTLGGGSTTELLTLADSTSAGASSVFTLNSGTVTNTAVSGGLKFGSSSANTASSTFHLNGGILTVASVFEGEAGHSSTFNFNGGTLTTRTGSTLGATFMAGIDTVNVRNGGAIFDTNGVNSTVAQALAHSIIGGDNATDGGLTKNGLGTLTLSGANTYTGATAITGGALVFANKAAKTASTATAAAAGSIGLGVKASDAAYYSATDVGDLFNTNTLTGFSLDAASGVAIDTTNAGGSFDQTVALNAAARGLTKTGTGTLILSQNNTYSGTTIEAGTLQIGTGGTSGTLGSGAVINNGALAFNRSDDVSISNVISGTGSLVKNGTNTLTSSAINTFTGAITINGGTLELSATNGGNAIFGSTQININGASTLRVSGTAANVPIFKAANYTFDSVGGGKIELGVGGNYDAGVANEPFSITTNGGAQNSIRIIGNGASGSNGFNLGGSVATFNIAAGSDATSDLVVTPIISNGGSVMKTGNGRLTLAGTNTYTGATTVSNGTLEVSGSLANTTSVSLTGGTLLLNNNSNNVVNTAATLNVAGGKLALDTAVNNQTQTYASLTLSGNSTLDFGGGANGNTLTFAAGGVSFAGTLAIWNWSSAGNSYDGSMADIGTLADNQDRLLFNAASGFSPSQFSAIQFYSDSGLTPIGSGSAQISFGGQFEIVPVPEPTTIFGALALLGLVGYRERRRLAGLLQISTPIPHPKSPA